jgi:hypothetical protein
MTSMPVIRSPSTWNARTTDSRPSCPHSSPGAVDEGQLAGARPLGRQHRALAHALDAAQHDRRRARADEPVRAQHHVRVEEREQRFEVATPRRGQERLDDLAPPRQARVRRGTALDPAPGPARELPGRRRSLVDHRRDLVERHREHVVQHERDPLGGRQRVEHHQQREPDSVGQLRLLLGVPPLLALFGPAVQRLLAVVATRPQHGQAHPRDDGRQPGADVLDLTRVGAVEPQPGLLEGVVGLARRTEHPVSDRPQPRPLLLEPLGQRVHRARLLRAAVVAVDPATAADVTRTLGRTE